MEDDDSARINILGGRLGVAEVEALLLQLAQWRQQQQPAVSDRPDQHLNSVLWEVDPMFAVSRSAEPMLVLGIKHSGYGWLCFELPKAKGTVLARNILKATGETAGSGGVLDGDLGGLAH
mgnify:FL=1